MENAEGDRYRVESVVPKASHPLLARRARVGLARAAERGEPPATLSSRGRAGIKGRLLSTGGTAGYQHEHHQRETSEETCGECHDARVGWEYGRNSIRSCR